MKAFLLAAGLGTRLRPLTDKIPKCLVPISGKPLMQIWLDLFQKHGITDILINTHHLPHLVEKYFKENGYSLSVNRIEETAFPNNLSTYDLGQLRITLSYEPILLGNAGTLLAHRKFVEGEKEFFIVNSDNLTNANLTELAKFHRSHDELFTMGLFKTDRPTACGIAQLDGNGKVVSFEEKPATPKTNLAAAGIYVASPEIFKFFPRKEEIGPYTPMDLGFHVLPRLVGRMYGYLIKDYLLDIGDFSNYQKAQLDWPKISSKI